MTLKRIMKITLMNVTLLLILFVIIEGLFMILINQTTVHDTTIKDDLFFILDSPDYEENKEFLFKLKPDRTFSWDYPAIHQTDIGGWRKSISDTPRIKDSNETLRIIILGDSSSFGLGVPFDKTYGETLKRIIENTSSKKVTIYNLAVPGFTSFQIKKVLENKISIIKPHVVIAYVGANDPAPVLEFSDQEYYDYINKKESLTKKILMKSNIYRFSKIFKQNKKISVVEESINELPNDIDWFSLSLPDIIIEMENSNLSQYKFFHKTRVSNAEFRKNIQFITKLSEKHKAKTIYIPNLWNSGNKLLYQKAYLVEPYLDIQEEFGKYPIEEVLLDTVHPSIKGHEIIAELIHNELLFLI